MASGATMKVEVVSPERVLFSGSATQVITRTESGGEIAFLPGHTSFLGVLTENHTRIFLEDGKVQRFLSQPFYVAEVFTGVKGEYVPTAETVESFEAIVKGELDEVPEQAFLNVGSVEQVLAKAKALQESAS